MFPVFLAEPQHRSSPGRWLAESRKERVGVSSEKRDGERARMVAEQLKELRVRGILVTAAKRGYITELACKMPECLCRGIVKSCGTESRDHAASS